ncbi:hypothetical protein HYV86_02425 [Candidatus Woesearchaeota archaeon]|nr:hypothetical protein [Candidatus Woesearchaeota archaeon]
MPTWSYVGIDECAASGTSQSPHNLVVVGATSLARRCTEYKPHNWLSKARGYLHADQPLPSLSYLHTEGLHNFAWMGMSSSTFRRSELEYGMIAQIVLRLCHDASRSVIHVDSFGCEQETTDVLVDLLHRKRFYIPRSQVEVHGSGDERMLLINHADLLAARIALSGSEQSPYFRTLVPLEEELIQKKRVEGLTAEDFHVLWDAVMYVRRRPTPYPVSLGTLGQTA